MFLWLFWGGAALSAQVVTAQYAIPVADSMPVTQVVTSAPADLQAAATAPGASSARHATPVINVAYSETKPAEAATTTTTGELNAEKIAEEIAAIEGLASIDQELKNDYLARLKRAADWLKDEQESVRRKQELEAQLASVPTLLKSVQSELAKPAAPPNVEFPNGATVVQLEAKLNELKNQLEVDEAAARSKEQECEKRPERLSEISKESIELDKKIAEAGQQIASLTEPDLTSKIKRIEQKARLRVRQQQLATLKAEQLRLEAMVELLPMQRDLAKRTASSSKKLLQSWQTAVDAWRKEESLRQAAEARRVAANSHPALKSLATQNAEIAELRIKTAAEIERLAKSIKEIKESLVKYADVFEELQKKVEHAGATSSTGVLLLKQRDELPRQETFIERAKFVRTAMPEAHLRLMELNRLRAEMSDPAEMAQRMLSTLNDSLSQYDESQVLEVVTQILTNRRDFLDKASADQNTYLKDLNELELANKALADQVEDFRHYLDQRVMWIRSAEPMSWKDLKQAGQGMMILISPSRWLEVLKVGGVELLRRPAGGIAVISLFMLLLLGRARLLAGQSRLMIPASEKETDGFWPKVVALLVAIVLSARWPVLLLAVGFRLKYAAGTTEWTWAVGQACLTTMVFLWGWELVREICRRGGIAERLFEWPAEATAAVRNSMEMTLLVGIPLVSLLQLAQFGALANLKGLERTLFVTTLMLCSLQLSMLLRPRGALITAFGSDERLSRGIFYRARAPIWTFTTFSPLALAILSAVGYHFSAYQLSARLLETGAAFIGIVLIHNMCLCWLAVKAHNLGMARRNDQPSETFTETLAPAVATIDEIDEPLPATAPAERNEVPESLIQFRDLLRHAAIMGLLCACWFIWASVLPALRILDQVELWQNIEKVAESVVDNDGREVLQMVEHSVPTTLTDLLAAVLICIATFTVGRKLPGMLELTVLERIPLDHGGRQAISILVRYAATLAGVLIACQMVRVSWSSVQWLAAAMTVGLGFGLQEIFANLVSGLIILFERPIRLGDLVTVGDVTGNVTRMQIRATTITDFDRRELIVPNKTFITDKVINWTLSDPISRVVLSVGVAYGSDVKLAQRVLLKIAQRNAIVLEEPKPFALFKGFGDSTLNLELRVFIPTRDVYLEVVNNINAEIAKDFQRAGIEIAFPQRDLRIRSIEGLAGILPGQQTTATAEEAA